MAMPVGAKRAAGQAAAWAVAISCTVVSLIYFTQIKDIARAMVGLPKISDPHRAGDVPVAGGERRSGARAQAGNTVELRAGSYGHYHADAEINGRRIEVMIDTGASQVALSFEDAARAGIYVRDSDFTQAVRTANGIARVAPVVLDRISIGDITVRNVPASVSERGMLGTTLLGMSFLKRLSRVDMRGDILLLQE